MHKVLVAEDETIERKVLCKTLNTHLGGICTVCEAKNGREAMEVFESEAPQIAILDIEMPGMNGLEVARRIRESGKYCVIIFMTAYDKFSYAKEAIAIRALDYLLKPYDEKELVMVVEEGIRVYDWMMEKPLRSEPTPLPVEQMLDEEARDTSLRVSRIREDITQYIVEHFSDDLSMQDVARAMNYSDAYFCKLFKQCFRVNFSAYLNEYRVDKAKQMLRSSRVSIKDISLACGYTDSNYFTRVFRRVTGMTPSEYRLDQTNKE